MTIASEINIVFESIFKQHYQRLCNYAYSFIKDEVTCEDIVQELFIKIWEKEKIDMGAEKIKFYLFTAVRNNCLTHLQKIKKVPFQELKDEDATSEIPMALAGEKETTEAKILVAKAMEQLPPKCKEVFLLSRLGQLTYQQIADSLGISVKTVENQMGKAIKTMKIFAKEHGIYILCLSFILFKKEYWENIGVFLKNWF